jgi:hypothetical protein
MIEKEKAGPDGPDGKAVSEKRGPDEREVKKADERDERKFENWLVEKI